MSLIPFCLYEHNKTGKMGLFICLILGLNFATAAEQIGGVLELDPQSGAASLRIPLGPGIGRVGLTYRPALVGRFAPLAKDRGPGDPGPVLAGRTGFELSPGSLDVGIGVVPSNHLIATWTYPDGSGGRTCDAQATGVTAPALWARFVRCAGKKDKAAPPPASILPVQDMQACLGGDYLLALPETPSDRGKEGVPSGLLAVRGDLAYEYRFATAGMPSPPPGARLAHYRLAAIRATSGESITFTYDPNGVGYEAAFGSTRVRVSLAGMAAAPPAPSLDSACCTASGREPGLDFRDVEAHLRITYEGGDVAQGYTLATLVGRDFSPSEGQPAPEAFRNSLQATLVQGDGDGEGIRFRYGKAPAAAHAGAAGTLDLAPTILREIVLPDRSLLLDWEGEPAPRDPAEASGAVGLSSGWLFGVAALHDRDPQGEPSGVPEYRRPSPFPAPGSPWVRQSRHFAGTQAQESGSSCETHIRDRWDFPKPCARPESHHQIPPPRAIFDYDGDIPTFERDPRTLALEPVPGRLTRWVTWDVAPGAKAQPPEMHGHRPPLAPCGFGLKGGSGRGQPGVWPGPIRYDPSKREVTMEAFAGPGASGRVPVGPYGPGIQGPAQMAQQIANNMQAMRETSQKAMADAARMQRESAAATARELEAQQARQRAMLDPMVKAQQQRMQEQMATQKRWAEDQLQRDAEARRRAEAERQQAEARQKAQTAQGIPPLSPEQRDGTPDKYSSSGALMWPASPPLQPGPGQVEVSLVGRSVDTAGMEDRPCHERGIAKLFDHSGTLVQISNGTCLVSSWEEDGLNHAGRSTPLSREDAVVRFGNGSLATVVEKWFVPSGRISQIEIDSLVAEWNNRKIRYEPKEGTTCNTFSRWFESRLGLQVPETTCWQMRGWEIVVP